MEVLTVIVDHLEWATLPSPLDAEIDVNRHVLDETLVAHDHDFVEVAVVAGGSAVHETLYGERRIGRGDAFVIRPGAWHAYRRCVQLAVVNCCFQARLLERELQWLAGEPRLRLLLWPGRGTDDGVVPVSLGAAAFQHLNEQLDQLATGPADLPRPYRIAHLLLLLRTLACELDMTQVAESERLAATPPTITDALRLLTDDLARPWRAEELAAAVGLSPAHFSRIFHQAVGRPPMAHLAVLRAEAAAARLLQSSEPLSVVGAAVGWADPNYFARRFRAHFGASPSEYRSRRSSTA
ncbi:helix-turn-helix domain-containing protein [Pseudonocardia sp. CA-107938]|uniref:helix-turn-helix domain-containing protein n=1 Tax=Pseudonocardia sp. CA-107938 TaxID=3240021 RepID=UPI003D8F1773